jgi:enediyne biosynthesis protein E4
MPDFALKDPNNLLLQSADGKFVEVGDKAGVASVAVARGAAMADFNLDGLVDLVVVNRREKAQIWRNTSENAGGWIEVRLQQTGANRDAVGAWIEVRCDETGVMRREITVGGGHAGGQHGAWHFGLGDATKVEIRVLWPDGTAGDWQAVAPNELYLVERDQPARKLLAEQ